jgi:hypothetical protein
LYEACTVKPSTITGRVYKKLFAPPAEVNIAASPAAVAVSAVPTLPSKLSQISPAAVASIADTAELPPFPENLTVPSVSEEIDTE